MRQSRTQFTTELTSGRVLATTIDSLLEHFDLVVNGYKVKTEDIGRQWWRLLLKARPFRAL